MSKAICPECNCEMFEYREKNKIFFNCTTCRETYELCKVNSQQLSELNQYTEGGHDVRFRDGFEGTGKPSKKSSADTIYNKKRGNK